MDFKRLILAKRFDEVAAAVSERYGVPVDPNRLAETIKPHAPNLARNHRLCLGWREPEWFSWLKNRLDELHAFQAGHKSFPASPWPVPLHVFFIHIEETPEMVARLAEGKPAQPTPARSRLPKSMLKTLRPIDAVAKRVAPTDSPATQAEGE